MKPTPAVQDVAVPTVDPRQRPGTPKESRGESQTQAIANIIVNSNQLKQQLLSKPAVTSTINKPPASPAGSDNPTLLSVINNNHTDTNLNINNNKTSANTNKDAVSHRTSQKKDPRLSSNSSGNLNSNNSSNKNLSLGSNSTSSVLLASNRGSGGSDSKSKESKISSSSSSSRGSSSSSGEKSSASSKSSHRKLGSKSRSKQPLTCPSKILKVDRDSSPVRPKSRENDNGDNSPSSRTPPQSSFQASSKSRKKNTKSRKRSPSPPYRIPRRNDSKSGSSLSSSAGVTEEEQSGSLIVSPPHPPAFKEIRPNARQRNYVRRNKDDSLSPQHSPASAGNAQIAAEPTLESSSKDEDLRAPLSLPGTAVSVSEKSKSAAFGKIYLFIFKLVRERALSLSLSFSLSRLCMRKSISILIYVLVRVSSLGLCLKFRPVYFLVKVTNAFICIISLLAKTGEIVEKEFFYSLHSSFAFLIFHFR